MEKNVLKKALKAFGLLLIAVLAVYIFSDTTEKFTTNMIFLSMYTFILASAWMISRLLMQKLYKKAKHPKVYYYLCLILTAVTIALPMRFILKQTSFYGKDPDIYSVIAGMFFVNFIFMPSFFQKEEPKAPSAKSEKENSAKPPHP